MFIYFQTYINLIYVQEKRKRREVRTKEREKLGDNAPPKQVPKTIENTREPDATYVDIADEEVSSFKIHIICLNEFLGSARRTDR